MRHELSHLLRGIPAPQRHRAVVQTLTVDGDAERCANLILASVTLPDAARQVEVDTPERRELVLYEPTRLR